MVTQWGRGVEVMWDGCQLRIFSKLDKFETTSIHHAFLYFHHQFRHGSSTASVSARCQLLANQGAQLLLWLNTALFVAPQNHREHVHQWWRAQMWPIGSMFGCEICAIWLIVIKFLVCPCSPCAHWFMAHQFFCKYTAMLVFHCLQKAALYCLHCDTQCVPGCECNAGICSWWYECAQ